MNKTLINPGQSEAGWHRIAKVIRCPALFRYSSNEPWPDAPPLVKGQLLHVGLAHHYELKRLRGKGKPTAHLWSPTQAIGQLALEQHALPHTTDMWMDLAPKIQAVMQDYALFWGEDPHWEVLAVEKELRLRVTDTERWQHSGDVGFHAGQPLWSKAEALGWGLVAYSRGTLDPNHLAPEFSPARYLYTQRADLIVRHRETRKVYIVDHKSTSRKIPTPPRKFTNDGQFVGYELFGKLNYKEKFGGVIANMIQLSDPPEFKRPSLEPSAHDLEQFKATIIHAERVIRNYQDKDIWPRAWLQTACFTYGVRCPFFEKCQWGEGPEKTDDTE